MRSFSPENASKTAKNGHFSPKSRDSIDEKIRKLALFIDSFDPNANFAKITENGAKIAEKGPKIAEKSPKIAENGPKIAEKSLKIAEITPKIAEKSLKIAEISPKTTENAPKVTFSAEKREKSPKMGENGRKIQELLDFYIKKRPQSPDPIDSYKFERKIR
jgi:ATPase subunit of ABC transporter with duplicated ATPase domains